MINGYVINDATLEPKVEGIVKACRHNIMLECASNWVSWSFKVYPAELDKCVSGNRYVLPIDQLKPKLRSTLDGVVGYLNVDNMRLDCIRL